MAAITGGVVDQDNSTSKRHSLTRSQIGKDMCQECINAMAAVTGGVVDQDNRTSKRQSHKIPGREGYVSVVYHPHGRRHGGESWTRTTAQVRVSLTRSQLGKDMCQ